MTLAASPELPRVNGWFPCSSTDDVAMYPSRPDFECAKVELPLCHDGVAGCNSTRLIEVFVKRKLARAGATSAAPKTIWFLEGGPGMSSVNLELAMLLLYAELDAAVNVYTMDHRGTGRSAFLDCDAAQARAEGSPGGAYIAFQELPACVRDALFEMDGQPAAFSVTSAARDVLALVELFRGNATHEQTALYGVSYGTYLVERVMHLAADHAPGLVQGFILDGVVDETDFYFARWNRNILAPSKRFLATCVDVPACPLRLEFRERVLEDVLRLYQDIDDSVASTGEPKDHAARRRRQCAAALSLTVDGGSMQLPPSYSLRTLFGVLVRDFAYRSLVFSLLARVHRCSREDLDELSFVMPPLMQQISDTYGSSASRSRRQRPWRLSWRLPRHHQSSPAHRRRVRQRLAAKYRLPTTTTSTTPTRQTPLRWSADPVHAASELLYNLIAFSELWPTPVPTEQQLLDEFLAGPFSELVDSVATYCLLTGKLHAETDERACRDAFASVQEQLGDLPVPAVETPFVYARDESWNRTAKVPAGASALMILGGLDFQTPSAFGSSEYHELGGDGQKMLVQFDFGVHGSGFVPTGADDVTRCGPTILASFVRELGDVARVDTSCLASVPAFEPSDDAFVEIIGEILLSAGLEAVEQY
ncbi:hypothetical protein P43SY_005949 [Pythium insidiosum]|uniref:Serine protease family S33 n=1 Tax=Pythium insidiosum TaxID=114742 RepID=A0AAD5Q8Y8_PYTIN|nr:hypothetical protein P43SY_005949 [Pythium insidiosum]